MIPGGTAVVPTRKPIEAGKTMWARLFDDLSGITSFGRCGCGASDRLTIWAGASGVWAS